MSTTDTVSESFEQATGARACGAELGLPALGGRVVDARLERIQDSPHFDGTRFSNLIPTPQTPQNMGSVAWEFVAGKQQREPAEPLPLTKPSLGQLAPNQGEPLRVTWLGHSTSLIEIDGRLVLTDPVLGPRAAPLTWMGPKRFHEAPLTPEELPPLDVVILSHDHYDHLDYWTVQRMLQRDVVWVTSLGCGAHLEAFGVRPSRIRELDWWEETEVKGLRIVATPARHFQGRGPGASKATFWSSWVVEGPTQRIFFSGDSGPHDEGYAEIGERFGGFDLTLIEIGAWHPAWGNIHMGPDNAMRTHKLLRGKTFMPVHWGTFNLALHAWDEPIKRAIELAAQEDVQLLSPTLGQTVHRESGVADFWLKR